MSVRRPPPLLLPLSPQDIQILQATADRLAQGQAAAARDLISPLCMALPHQAEPQRLLGRALQALGDYTGAEAAFRAGLANDKRHVGLMVDLAGLFAVLGRVREAEKTLRAALALAPRDVATAVALSDILLAEGRADEALRVTAVLAAAPKADERVLAARGSVLKALGRKDAALEVYQRAVESAPQSRTAAHNLAAIQGDLGRFEAAAAGARRAFALGLDAPETWLVYGRALVGLGRLDEAERALRESIRRRPYSGDAHQDLAQLIWMRTAKAGEAAAVLDLALRSAPAGQTARDLALLKANILRAAGEFAAAYASINRAVTAEPTAAALRQSAAHLAALAGRPSEGVDHARAAVACAPHLIDAQAALCAAYLAVGEAAQAAALAGQLRARNAYDQTAIAYQATAWRIMGDDRYGALYDYAGLVRSWRLDTPKGWSSLEAFLADLQATLLALHPYKSHPLNQSLRHGSQASQLNGSADPVIRAYFEALQGPITRHLAALGAGKDPVRSRLGRGFVFQGAWSVKLHPGGFHADHIHAEGWLSSASYIALPQAVAASPGREGWIKFGEPGVPTAQKLTPERFIQPEPGLVVLFPSYMWHGTVPFSGDEPRLSLAFDLKPGG
jgi:tetratricopeptide (TPR) repeat protein